jgi:hypothetical protein
LHQLRARREEAGRFADALAVLIGYMANWERELVPDPTQEVTMDVDLGPHCEGMLRQLGDDFRAVSNADVISVLQREYAPTSILGGTGGSGLARLRMFLAPFHGVQSAHEYMGRIAETQAAVSNPLLSPRVLPQMLDYLSLLLSADSAWNGDPLVTAPDLRSAGVLFADVSTEAEYRDALSGLAAILGALRTPPIPVEDLGSTRFRGVQPGSLTRLGYWFEQRLKGGPGQARTQQGLDTLREIVRLRVEGAHASDGARKRGAVARQRLGLPDLIIDWALAWDTVRARAADAVDVLASELRLAGLPAE